MLVGYARVSIAEQSLALQQDALTAAGCGRVYTDVDVRLLVADLLARLRLHERAADVGG